jgi:hypothetical protein
MAKLAQTAVAIDPAVLKKAEQEKKMKLIKNGLIAVAVVVVGFFAYKKFVK